MSKGHVHDGALLVMGPGSRDLLTRLTDADLSASAAPWMSVAELTIAGAAVTALRVSYVGELGWELHTASKDLASLYAAIMRAGVEEGVCDFGSYALNAMRIEKGYHGWGADFGSEYTLFDAGLAGFAAMGKAEFIGRDSVLRQAEVAPEWEFVGLEVTVPGPDPLPSDPILLGEEVIGYVTSATEGFRTGKLLVLGYVRHGTLPMGGACDVLAFGKARRAVRHAPRVYDPDNAKLRG